ncbi:hypothetical protein ACFL2O_05540 [Thermodesulfobacteriota bacterium]
MKCPKCGYISFDYNHTCPKCNKNISAEREKMNLPDYQPNPPFLLGSLIDGTRKLGAAPGGGSQKMPSAGNVPSFSDDDSEAIGAISDAFEDSQDLDIQLGTSADIELEDSFEDTVEPIDLDESMMSPGDDSIAADDVDLNMTDSVTRDFGGTLDGEPSVVGEMSDDDISLASTPESSVEEADSVEMSVEEEIEQKEKEIDLTLKGLNLEETSDFELEPSATVDAGPEAPTKGEEKPKKEEKPKSEGTLALDLDSIDLDLDLDSP